MQLRSQQNLCGEFLHCALSLAAQCIVIGPVCVCVCLWVCLFVGLLLQPARSVCVSVRAFYIDTESQSVGNVAASTVAFGERESEPHERQTDSQ